MKSFNFTIKELDKISSAKKGSRDTYHDTIVKGLTLRVTATGVKTFLVRKRVRVDEKTITDTLGHYPSMTINQARNAARVSLNSFSEGVNPNNVNANNKVRSITLQKVMDDYLSSKRNNLKKKTAADYQILFNGYLSEWKSKKLVEITRPMVDKKHKAIGIKTIYRANAVMRLLRALFNYAIGEYEDSNNIPVIVHNPVQKISHNKSWFKEKVRTNIIKPNDLQDWFFAVHNLSNCKTNANYKNTSETVSDYLILLIFTGLRFSEGINLEWDDIDFKNSTLNVKNTKNHKDHTLPLTDYIVKLLKKRQEKSKGIFVFSGSNPNKALVNPNRQIKKVVGNSGIQFTAHDLRRSFTTYADSLEIKHTTIKRLINHTDNDVTSKHYIQPSIERLRGPMQQITNYILGEAGIK